VTLGLGLSCSAAWVQDRVTAHLQPQPAWVDYAHVFQDRLLPLTIHHVQFVPTESGLHRQAKRVVRAVQRGNQPVSAALLLHGLHPLGVHQRINVSTVRPTCILVTLVQNACAALNQLFLPLGQLCATRLIDSHKDNFIPMNASAI